MNRRGFGHSMVALVSLFCIVLAGVGFDLHYTEDGRVIIASAYDTADCSAIHPEMECCGEVLPACSDATSECCSLSDSCGCVDDVLVLSQGVLVPHFGFFPVLPSRALFSFEPGMSQNFNFNLFHHTRTIQGPGHFHVLRT